MFLSSSSLGLATCLSRRIWTSLYEKAIPAPHPTDISVFFFLSCVSLSRACMSQACAHFGGICVGTDIDVRVLKGKIAGRNVFTNFGAVERRPLAPFERGQGTVGGDLFLNRDALRVLMSF